MAPEQAAGQSHRIGPHTDVYSLGAILYELLSGRLPYPTSSSADALVQVLARDPIPLRPRQPNVPRDLETICLKCLEKEPARRYQSALELAEELRRFQEGRPILARPVGAVERLGKWARRHPVVAALAAGLVLVTALGFAGVSAALLYALQGWSVAAEEKIKVEEEREVARGERAIAEHQREIARGERALAVSAQEKEADHRRRADRARIKAESTLVFNRLAQAALLWQANKLGDSSARLARIEPDRRGWEWHYLDGLHRGELRLFARPEQVQVSGVAFSPRGKLLAASGGNPFRPVGRQSAEVALWDTDSGRLVRVLRGMPVVPGRVAFSPCGKLLAAAGAGAWTIRLWDAETGKLLRDLRGGGRMDDFAWSPDSKHIAAADHSGQVVVWETANGKRASTLHRGNGQVRAVAWSPCGKYIASAGDNVRLYEAVGGRLVKQLDHGAASLAFAPDSRTLACAVGSIVHLCSVPDGLSRTSLGGHTGRVSAVTFSPDGLLLASAGADTTVRIWSTDGRQLSVWRGHRGRVETVAFHPSGWMVASGSAQPGDVRLWDLTRHQEHTLAAGEAHSNWIDALAFTPDRHEVIFQRRNGGLEVHDPATGLLHSLRQLPIHSLWHTPGVLGVFSGDVRTLVATDDRDAGRACAWDVRTGKPLPGSFRHRGSIWLVSCSRDGRLAASASVGARDGVFACEQAVWEPATGKVVWRHEQASARVQALVLSPDGRYLARAVSDLSSGMRAGGQVLARPIRARVEVWEVPAGQKPPAAPWRTFRPGDIDVYGLAFRGDGGLLAASTFSGKVHLWELPSGRPLHDRPLSGPSGLEGLAFCPDGRRLAGASRMSVIVWDVAEGHEGLTLSGAEPRPSDPGFSPRVAWSADGRFLAASNWDHSVSVWDGIDLAKEESRDLLRRTARQRLPRWHLDNADRAWRSGRAQAAAYHLEQMAQLGRELEGGWCLLRGDLLARMGRWDSAAADFARALEAEPGHSAWVWRKHALLQARAGKRDVCSRLGPFLLERFAGDTSIGARSQATLACCVLPGMVAAPERLVLLAQETLAAADGAQGGWYHHTLAAASLRAGRYRQAIRSAERSLKVDAAWARNHPMNWLVLALAHQRQGNKEEEQRWSEQARAWFAEEEKKLAVSGHRVPPGLEWQDWLWMLQLRDEVARTPGK
jgi:WD40 repeat protein